MEEINTLCGICPAGCWVKAGLTDGRLTGVRADEDHPLGMICELGRHSPEIVYSEHRLRQPLRRVGPKGSYEFEPLSWDEAFETIVDRLNGIKATFGPEAAAIYTGRGSFDQALCDVFQPLDTAVSSASSVLFPFGSPNTFGVGALCYVSYAMIAPHSTVGGMLIDMDSEVDQAELIVVWGANPATDCPPLVHGQILDAARRGAEIVVIDPRRSETARACDAEWIPIRPGTDGALALGMIQVLIEDELFDEDFVADWTIGFAELKQYAQHFRPEIVADITGVPADTVRSLARRIRRARGAAPVMYTGLEYSNSGVQAIRATLILWALAGQLDTPGGRVFRMRENAFPINKSGLISNPDVKLAVGRDRFPVYSHYRGESHAIALPEAVLEGRPYPIKSLIIQGGSIITAWPQPEIWRRTLGALDFLVTIDRQLTADSAYADIVLPATTGYENLSYMVYGPLFRIRERLIEPVGEARNDFQIMAELADRLGYGHLYPQSEEALLDHVLRGSGFTAADVRRAGGAAAGPTVMMQYKKWEKGLLRPDGRPGFATPSGKLEIASSLLMDHGYDGLPVYTEPKESPRRSGGRGGRYPLVFNSGARVKTDFRSQHHGIDGLTRGAPEPVVTMNTDDAADRGLKNGDAVYVVTPRGRARFRARVTDDMIRGSIDANMGGGGPVGPRAWRECNVNELTDLKNYDPISGFPVYKALVCEVEAIAAETAVDIADPEITERLEAVVSGNRRGGRPEKDSPVVYLDHNATTPLDRRVLRAMMPWLRQNYGNPSSLHSLGMDARQTVDDARRALAQAINATARQIVFTGGGSEADNLAIKGIAYAYRDRGRHIITSAIEHPAVLAACRALEKQGWRVTYLPVDGSGLVDPDELDLAFQPDTVLVSIMTANNETGAIQPIVELAGLSKQREVFFHTDAVQALGKVSIDVVESGIDLLSLSAHKIHGPKGTGALFVRRGIELAPLIDGGGQEHGLRSGTENVAAIAGLAKAAELAVSALPDMERVGRLRDRLENGIMEMAAARLNGPAIERLPNTLNVSLAGLRGESVVLQLDRKGICVSSGSACKSGSPQPSHALMALGISEADAHCSLRFSLGRDNTEDDIDRTLSALAAVVRESATTVRFVPCR